MARHRDLIASNKDYNPASKHSYKPGALRKLELQNFMCHEQFSQEFGPRVNFIIGPNGSGKSAVLTAIVVALGGRATTTSRAKKASDFVQYGKKFARITLHLQNYDSNLDQSQAFKPEDYGKLIIVEKIIYKDDQSGRLILKNDQGKRVSERRQELDQILDHFSILVNNPICVLNQEVSKSFLHSKKPEDKFELFMKATSLEQIDNDYAEAQAQHSEWHESNNRKAFAYKLIEDERLRHKEKLNFLENRVKLETKLGQLNMDLIWAMRHDDEVKAMKLEEKIAEKTRCLEEGDAQINGSRSKIADARSRIEEHETKIKHAKEELDASRKKVATLRDEELKIKSEKINTETTLNLDRRKLARLDKDKADLIRSIDNIKGQLNNKDSAVENEKRKLEIEQIERDTKLLCAKDMALRQRSEQIHKSMTDVKQQIGAAINRTSALRSELRSLENSLRSLSAGDCNVLRKFGPNMQKICDAVDEAHKSGTFQKKPLGPLGFFIRVKTPKVASALELNLGKNALCFTCDNHADMAALRRVFQRVSRASGDSYFREPPIFVRKFTKRHDVSKFKPVHDVHKSMLDHLEISEDAVFNALVDRTGIESVMFIPDYNEARNIMITPSLVPRGARSAYTEDCHVMYPRTQHGGFRSMALNSQGIKYWFTTGNEEQIREKKKEIERVKADLRDAEENEKRLKDSDRAQRMEYDKTMSECQRILNDLRPLETRLLELKTTLAEDQPQELIMLESELETCIAKIQEIKTKIAEQEHKLATKDSELVEKNLEKESAIKVQSLKDKSIEDLKDKKEAENDLIKQHEETIGMIERNMREANGIIEKLTVELSKTKSSINEHDKVAQEFPRPSEIRATNIIQEEIKDINRKLQVQIDENVDPNVLMERCRERLEEIGQVFQMRDTNATIFGRSMKSLKDREEGFKMLRKNVCASVSVAFSSVMKSMNMEGQLAIYFSDYVVNGHTVSKAGTLEMSIDTGKTSGAVSQRPMIDANNAAGDARRATRSQPAESGSAPRSKRARLTGSPSEKENHKMTDTRSLSGGERSFSTVAFVLSLWHHCKTPFKLMDEIDVFMDMVTRRMSYDALIKFAKQPEHIGQFIYFSPLELPQIDNPDDLVRVFEMPRINRQGTSSEPCD